jgi:hypothetical protein
MGEAREGVILILTRLKVDASDVQASLTLARQAWDDADSSRSVSPCLHLLHDDPLDSVQYVFETVANTSSENLNSWWIPEKLSSWLDQLSAAEISIGSVITLLNSWASFDPPKEQAERSSKADGTRRLGHPFLAKKVLTLSFSVGRPILTVWFCKGGSFVFLFH